MSKAIAVCISDIHFNINTLPLASAALEAAIKKSNALKIPLIIAGDLHDTKAIIRGEVANKLIELLQKAKTQVCILVGNHDLLNEKASEHGLNYLRPHATIVDRITHIDALELWLLPYYNDRSALEQALTTIPTASKILMHQGFLGAKMGDYIQDRTSISPEAVKDFIVISGHYHRHQTVGTITYIGSPYTITFGEANDGPKGFLVLNSDGTFTREILNLRKHVIVERPVEDLSRPELGVKSDDLLWLKVTGPRSELDKIKKSDIGAVFLGHNNFKLDLIPNDSAKLEQVTDNMTDEQIFDAMIDNENDTDEQKQYLKTLWKEITT